jgi:hypothetical protein
MHKERLMQSVKLIISIASLCAVMSGYAAVTHWWFHPDGLVPSGMPGPGSDNTNIALRGWADTQLDANLPLHAFGKQSTGQSASNIARRLPVNLMFDVTEAYNILPAGSPVIGAELYLRVFAAASDDPSTAFSLFPVLASWNEVSATWQSPWATPGGDFGPELAAVACGSPDQHHYITVDVTDAVKYEYSHIGSGTSTFGFALKDISGACPYVFTRETGVALQRPYLHIIIPEPISVCMIFALLTGLLMKYGKH